jgi:hypothetical protein
MKWLIASTVFMLAALAAISASEPPPTFEYEVVAVKRQLFLDTGDGERELQVGDLAESGDSLRTGSRSRAELEVSEQAARFVISSNTRFRLAHDKPGVLLELELGSLRAIFGKLTEGDERERLVTTPSAVLAVRGTEYGVEVKKDGDTSVTVFEGTVEVWEASGAGERIRVRAGYQAKVKKGKAPSKPKPHGLSSGDWERGYRKSSPTMRGMGPSQGMGQSPGAGPGSQQGSGGSQSRQGGSKKHGG